MASFASSPVALDVYDGSRQTDHVDLPPSKMLKLSPVEWEKDAGIEPESEGSCKKEEGLEPELEGSCEKEEGLEPESKGSCEKEEGLEPESEGSFEEKEGLEEGSCEEEEGLEELKAEESSDFDRALHSPPMVIPKLSKRFRHYFEMVKASEGFEVPSRSEVYSESDPEESDDDEIMNGIVKFSGPTDAGSEMWNIAEFAVREHNSKTGSNLELSRIVKANHELVCGFFNYITLEANDQRIYRAKVYTSFKEDVMELEVFKAA